jgi:CheY-like chemotaxis protein
MKKPILIVDDEEGIREMLKLAFQTYEYPVMLATNGREALTQLREQRPGLIVLDLMMPVMDGRKFAETLAPHPEWGTIPIIVITAFPGEAQAAIPGARVLEKPVDLDVLLEEAEKHCG